MQNYDSIMNSALPQQLPAENWYDMTIKSEPMDNAGSYNNQQFHHQHHHHPHQDTPMSHSSPTSPQSVDSMDSMSSRSQYFESKASSGIMHGYTPLGFNPLTPPGYAGMFVPPQQHLTRQTTPNRNFGKQDSGFVSSSLTPTHTPPMDVTPPKSPKEVAQTPEKAEDHSSDCEEFFDGSEDEDGIRKPKINSHGKVKKFKCKQCNFVAVTKLSFWEHTRGHIKPEKMLTCTQCPFVTEYKHHLEYHMRNHDRSKPFQCPKCSYSCVNKSMLNSHMKSHSNVFQYRCADCNYATKYCHSLKLHLRKYEHKPDVVLNVDGTPNPYPIIDVYGTRRGPKTKSQKLADQKAEAQQQSSHSTAASLTPKPHQPVQNQTPFTPPSSQAENLPRNLLPLNLLRNPLAHMFKNAASNNLPLFPYLNLNFQMFADQQAAIAQLSPNYHQQFTGLYHDKPNNEDADTGSKNDSPPSSPFKAPTATTTTLGEELLKHITAAAADSSDLKPESNTPSSDAEIEPQNELPEQTATPPVETIQEQIPPRIPEANPTSTTIASKSRRKGRAYKLDRMNGFLQAQDYEPAPMELSDAEQSDGEQSATITKQQKVPCAESKQSTMVDSAVQTNSPKLFRCKYCGISFENDAMYAIHMGYHGYDDVYKCNMCGEKCNDQLGFFLHIAQKAH